MGMKTAISLPDDLFKRAEVAAADLHVSRSELYRRALQIFLDHQPPVPLTEQLDRFFEAHAQVNALEPGWAEAQADVAARDPW